MKLIKILFRLIAFPFVAGVVLIAMIRNYFFTCWLWLSRGGELMMHDDTFNPETLRESVKKLDEILKRAGGI